MWTWLLIKTMTVLFEKDIGKQNLFTGQNEKKRRQTDVCCPNQSVNLLA